MNRHSFSAITLVFCSIFMLGYSGTVSAQDWYQGKTAGIYNVGIGGADGIGVYANDGYRYHHITQPGLSINASGEYKVHKFVSVGWQTGLNFYFTPSNVYHPYFVPQSIEIPFIVKANFHILEATNVRVKNKVDLYAGLQFGGGPAITYGNNNYYAGASSVFGVIHVGPQVGVRYWITNKIGVFGEFGWGATFCNAGITI